MNPILPRLALPAHWAGEVNRLENLSEPGGFAFGVVFADDGASFLEPGGRWYGRLTARRFASGRWGLTLEAGPSCALVLDLETQEAETVRTLLRTIDEGAAFVCPECMRGMPPSMGAADDAPDLCDDCWAARY
jgi:hypothetical protein